jgi:DNA-directed RNA polymerase specialized sigma24 family protein
MENNEIARITGKKEGAIRITQMRALAALREIMSKGK